MQDKRTITAVNTFLIDACTVDDFLLPLTAAMQGWLRDGVLSEPLGTLPAQQPAAA